MKKIVLVATLVAAIFGTSTFANAAKITPSKVNNVEKKGKIAQKLAKHKEKKAAKHQEKMAKKAAKSTK